MGDQSLKDDLSNVDITRNDATHLEQCCSSYVELLQFCSATRRQDLSLKVDCKIKGITSIH